MSESQYPIERFFIEEDNCVHYENLDEVISAWPSVEEFEQGSEWTWSLDGVDEDGDPYHWGISSYFDYGDEVVRARLYRLYIGSGSPQKNPTHSVVTLAYQLDDSHYPGDEAFDELCEILIEMIRRAIPSE